MKAICLLVSLVFIASNLFAQGYHKVTGYYRSNGTYVKPHYRTNPNKTINDNWSTAPNINPFTGKVGTIAPDISQYNSNSSYNSLYQSNSTLTPSSSPLDNAYLNSLIQSAPVPSSSHTTGSSLNSTLSFPPPTLPAPKAALDLTPFYIKP